MQPISVDALTNAVEMNVSVFHRHPRTMTASSPLQLQKQLCLIYARRLILAEGMSITQAVREVGYISVSQLIREYVRLHDALSDRGRWRRKMST